MQTQERIIQYYQQANGKFPFTDWILGLADKKARSIIFQCIDRIRLGNFGDCQNLGASIFELRISWGPGFRIYYGLDGLRIVLLLCGGDKSSQHRDITYAQEIWKEYKKNAHEII